MKNRELWEKLQALTFEPSFRAKLAHEHGWSDDFANEAIEEYKKFIYLAVVAAPATPSITVDKVWHLHLTHTQHYWGELCNKILGQPLHHVPTTDSESDEAKFAAQYLTTYNSYSQEFGAPDTSFWGVPFELRKELQSNPIKKSKFYYKYFWKIELLLLTVSFNVGLFTPSFLVGFVLTLLILNSVYLLVFSFLPEENRVYNKSADKSKNGCGSSSVVSCGGSDGGGGGGCGGGD